MITEKFDINDDNEKIVYSAYGKYIIFDLVNFEYAVLSKVECKKLLNKKKKYSEVKCIENNSLKNIFNNSNILEVKTVFITGFDCNYSCSYCYQSEYDKKIPKMRKEDLLKIKEFYEEYSKIYGVEIVITEISIIGGEPFLNNNYDFIKAVFEEFPLAKLSFISNGANIEPFYEMIKEFKNRIKVIVLSVDGDRELHLKYRHTSNDSYYENIWATVNFFRNEGIKFALNTVLHDEDTKYYSVFFNIAEKHGWKNNEFDISFSLDANKEKDIEYLTHMQGVWINLLKTDIRANMIHQDILDYSYKHILYRIVERASRKEYKTCLITTSPSYTFLPTGEVVPCLLGYEKKLKVGKFKPEISIDRDMVDRLTGRDFRNINECKKCEKKYFCRGGCIVEGIASNSNGDYYCGRWNENDYEKSLKLVLERLIIEEVGKKS